MNKSYIPIVSRLGMIIIILSFNLRSVAQSITDTILCIPDVIVSASRSEHFREDIKIEDFGKEELSIYTGESLSRFLTEETALNIKAYGVGGAASSIAIRGASSSQVQVNWNGFPINSVTLGSCDLSLVPSAGFDRVSLVYGASGAVYGSGTFGGAVDLNNDLQTGKELSGGVFMNYKSLKTINGGASFNISNKRMAYNITVWGAGSKNEFSYYDYIDQRQKKQTNGDWSDGGVIHNLAWKMSPSSSVETGLWYEAKSYDIPSRIGSTTYEYQKDSTLKIYLGYKYLRNRWSFKVKTARFEDKEDYWQKTFANASINSLESRIASVQYFSDANFRYYIENRFSVDAGVTGSWITADVSSYGGKKTENGVAVFTGLKYIYNRFTLQTTLRNEWNNTFQSGLLPSFGLTWKVLPDKMKLRANFSQKFRKPTFNDLFWMPGGNSSLKPEKGYTAEAGSEAVIWKEDKSSLITDVSIYYTHIRNMIVWRPAGAYWEAENYQTVNSKGMDISAKFNLEHKRFEYTSLLKVTLNHSVVTSSSEDDEEIMLYSPRVITSWENRVTLGLFDFTIWHHFTADRYYDEGRLLDPYNLIDIKTGAKIPVGKGKLGIHALVNNLTNTVYEVVRLYPMPKRYWTIKLDYTFKY